MARTSATSDALNAIAGADRREIVDVLMAGEKTIVDDLSRTGVAGCTARLRPLRGWLARYGRHGTADWIGWTTISKSYDNRRAAVTPDRHGSAVVELPDDLSVLTTREFDAPVALVFDVWTTPEHVRKWFAPPGAR